MIRFDPIGRIEIMQQLQVLEGKAIIPKEVISVIGNFRHSGTWWEYLVVAAY
jgi:hypothetical protein